MKADETDWHDVGPVALLEREGLLTARIGGREIGVVATPDGPRAVRNRCPHQGGARSVGAPSRCVSKAHPVGTTREIASCSAAPGMVGSSTCTQAGAPTTQRYA
jgi:hypothetical protein